MGIRVHRAARVASVRHRVTAHAVRLEIVRQGAPAAVPARGVRRVQARVATVPQGVKGVVRLPAVMGIAATVRHVRPRSAKTKNK